MIDALPGVQRIPESHIADEVIALYELGIRYVMPFGISHHKDECGSDTWHDNGLLSRMIKAIKTACPDMIVIPDICFVSTPLTAIVVWCTKAMSITIKRSKIW